MADNVDVTPGTGKTIGTDEVVDADLGTVQIQYVKIMDGTINGTDKAAVGSNGLVVDGSGVTQPISGSVSVSNFPATQPVSGTVAATQSGTWTVQPGNTANTTAWKVDGSAVTQPVSGPLTNAQLRAAVVPVDGSSVTQPVSGPLTDTQLRATPVPVDGSGSTQPISGTVSVSNFPATQPISGTVAATQSGTWTVQPGNTANTTAWKVDGSAVVQPVSGTVVATGPLTDTQLRASPVPVSGPLTDTQLRATPVPVSGTVSTGGLTDAQLRATPVPVSGTVTATGPLTDTQLRATPVPVSGTVTATGPLTDTQLRATPVPISGTVSTGGLTDTQLRATPVPISGTVAVSGTVPVSGTVTANAGTGNFTVVQGTGTNLHAVIDTGSTTAVTGNVTVVQPTGTNLHAVMDTGSTTAVTGNVTAVQSTGTNLHTVVDSGAVTVTGNVASGTADTGNPVKVGMQAIAFGTNPTAVAAAARTDLYANRAGVPFFLGGHPNIVTLEAAYTAAQTDTAIVTVAAGLKIVVTQIQMTVNEATTVGVNFRVGFGTANTPTTTGVVLTHPGLVPGAGISRGDGAGILGVGADNEDLRITSSVPTTGSIRILVSYFTIES